MEDDLGALLAEASARILRLVADVGDERDDLDLGAGPPQLAVDLEERKLGALDEQELRRLEPGDLARQLRADRAARAGDHDPLAGQEVPDLLLVEVDRLAAEEVLDLHVADARDLHLALEDRRRGPG